ncbi:sugar ABC transporter permease [Paenibacillus glucanolyticus]|jgi:multiple sugar transport system permease protein|uniref:carbohydrate ABC transporter permease n=1 Tax=Paenibacillus TaxID=44249 RepID=UPI0003E1BD6B|nr:MULTISPECIES: sugar ABC transporter permease [Paenibacillus]ANA80998.1 sugar ABC transporter permease [Paenibacillus glucanolyticus]AVV54930.1 sugar ABC transporter permease [Paenibacillus glucanolyticus]ETT36442.1 binding-protein-dependent transport systems inner membrane component [Paenibacillus sp. FSL R5-808]OMF70934.1 sugar ABC transporter permease [Paenibacillus glucanolyticus]
MSQTMETVKKPGPQITGRPKPRGSLRRGENVWGILFVSPMLFGVIILVLFPILATLVLGFADWNFVQGWDGIQWVGFQNFRHLLEDDIFLKSVRNNLIFLLTVPIYMMISMLLAILIDRFVYMKGYFKVAYFMPYISNIVAVAVVWQVLFQPSYGPINEILRTIGISNPPKWIADPNFALISIMLISIWISIGFNLIIYIAGLQSIPKDLYEAADIDGANGWTKFRRITLPLLSPTSFFLLVTGVISTFKVFDIIAVMTQGGPIGSTTMMVWYLYDTAFVNLKVGYASSIAAVLFGFVMLITLGQWAAQKKWVNY